MFENVTPGDRLIRIAEFERPRIVTVDHVSDGEVTTTDGRYYRAATGAECGTATGGSISFAPRSLILSIRYQEAMRDHMGQVAGLHRHLSTFSPEDYIDAVEGYLDEMRERVATIQDEER